MKVLKGFGNFFAIIFAIMLFVIQMITHLYIVFCSVMEKDTINKMTNSVSAVELLNTDGKKNKLYYDVKKKFGLSEEVLDSMIGSKLVNDCVSDLINNIVLKSKTDSNYKMSDKEFIEIVNDRVNSDKYNLTNSNKKMIINFVKSNSSEIIKEIYDLGGSYNE